MIVLTLTSLCASPSQRYMPQSEHLNQVSKQESERIRQQPNYQQPPYKLPSEELNFHGCFSSSVTALISIKNIDYHDA